MYVSTCLYMYVFTHVITSNSINHACSVPGWDGGGQCPGRQRAERLPGPGHSLDDPSLVPGAHRRLPLAPWTGFDAQGFH